MNINPVYIKELKVNVRTAKMATIIFGYNFLLALIGLFAFYLTFEKTAWYGRINYSDMLTIYTTIGVIEIGLVLFTIPAFTAGAISGERERQTLEILLTSRLRPIDIILGKLGSSISALLLLVISSLPVLALVFAVGGVGIKDLIQLMLLAIVTAVFVGSIGLFFSTVLKKTTLATVFTYGTVILLIIGTITIVWAVYSVMEMSGDRSFDTYGNYIAPDVGNLVLILLLNPIVTILAMITEQFGSHSEFTLFLEQFGKGNEFVVYHWFIISIISQLILAFVFVLISAKLLNPLRRKS